MNAPLRIGPAALTWNRERITLRPDHAPAIELSPSGGGLREAPLDRTPERALLATRLHAVLADGRAPRLTEVAFGTEILAAQIGADRALLVGRELAKTFDFLSGTELDAVAPGGQARPELGLPVLGGGAFGVAFHERMAVFPLAGSTSVHLVQAGFPFFKPVGSFLLAGGRDLLVLVAGAVSAQPVTKSTNGALRHELARVKQDLAAIPARDHVYIVDGVEGRIHEVSVEGAILQLALQDELVVVTSGGNRSMRFDRQGRRVSPAM